MSKKIYVGNNPGSPNYDPNIPIGFNQWDASEIYGDDFPDDDWEEEPEKEIPDEEEKINQIKK